MSLTGETEKFYTIEQLSTLDPQHIPQHVAFIPDGNRRWAKRLEFSSVEGHRHGADILMDIVKAGKEMGIKVMTFYFFSTENWLRAKEEVHALMWLLQTYLSEQCQTMIDNGIRFQCIGDLSKIPEDVYKTVQETKQATALCDKVELVLAINYGSRDEICRAVQAIAADHKNDKFSSKEIDERLISSYLDTATFPDPDLLIRTSGEMRISNFLLWQLSYTEIYAPKTLWPEFTPNHFLDAIMEYQKRERRLGGK